MAAVANAGHVIMGLQQSNPSLLSVFGHAFRSAMFNVHAQGERVVADRVILP
jgi:hypothetical protein